MADRRKLRAIRDRLRREYGRPVLRPHRAPVDELVLTVLSQNTNDRNRDVAYARLRERFDSWAEVRDATIALLGGVTFADLAKRAGGPWIDPALIAPVPNPATSASPAG